MFYRFFIATSPLAYAVQLTPQSPLDSVPQELRRISSGQDGEMMARYYQSVGSCTPCVFQGDDTRPEFMDRFSGSPSDRQLAAVADELRLKEVLSKEDAIRVSQRRPKLVETMQISADEDDRACSMSGLAVAGGRFQEFMASKGGWPADVKRFAENLTMGKTKIMFVSDYSGEVSDGEFINLFCGLQRLGLLDRVILLALNPNAKKVAEDNGVPTLYSPDLMQLIGKMGTLNGVAMPNRLAKLVGALLLLEHGHDVLISDTDTVWISDPFPTLDALDDDIVGMRDGCWADMNTGFLQYRANERSIGVLHTSLGYEKNRSQCTDNDQYLFNCAWVHHTIHNDLKLRTLNDGVLLGRHGKCSSSWTPIPVNETEPLMVWHSFGGSEPLQFNAAAYALVGFDNVRERGIGLRGCKRGLRSEEESQLMSWKVRHRCNSQWVGALCDNNYHEQCTPTVGDLRVLAQRFGKSAAKQDLRSFFPRTFGLLIHMPDSDGDFSWQAGVTVGDLVNMLQQVDDSVNESSPVSVVSEKFASMRDSIVLMRDSLMGNIPHI